MFELGMSLNREPGYFFVDKNQPPHKECPLLLTGTLKYVSFRLFSGWLKGI